MTTIVAAARTGLDAHRVHHTIASYRRLHQDQDPHAVAARTAAAQAMTNQYYDLVTNFYEFGWGRSFHFAHRTPGETMRQAIVRHEHRLALRLGIGPASRVLDLGCGVGGPLINIARLTDAEMVGLNNNAYQIQRGTRHIRDARLQRRCRMVHGDFMRIPADVGTFDAAYAIESTCHAPDRGRVFAEVFRVLRPGGMFGGYEWCLTPRFDPRNLRHRAIKRDIEEGNALPDIAPTSHIDRALAGAGFEVLEAQDLAPLCPADLPWYRSLEGELTTVAGLGRTRNGRRITATTVSLLEHLRLAPRGAREVHRVLETAADGLVLGGRQGLFTPLYLFVARRPG